MISKYESSLILNSQNVLIVFVRVNFEATCVLLPSWEPLHWDQVVRQVFSFRHYPRLLDHLHDLFPFCEKFLSRACVLSFKGFHIFNYALDHIRVRVLRPDLANVKLQSLDVPLALHRYVSPLQLLVLLYDQLLPKLLLFDWWQEADLPYVVKWDALYFGLIKLRIVYSR